MTMTGTLEWVAMLGFAAALVVAPFCIAVCRRTGEEWRVAVLTVVGVCTVGVVLVLAWWVALTAPGKSRRAGSRRTPTRVPVAWR